MTNAKALSIYAVIVSVAGFLFLFKHIATVSDSEAYYEEAMNRYPPIGIEAPWPFNPKLTGIGIVRDTGLALTTTCDIGAQNFEECINNDPASKGQLQIIPSKQATRTCPEGTLKVRLEGKIVGMRHYYACYLLPKPPAPKPEVKPAKAPPKKEAVKKDAKKK